MSLQHSRGLLPLAGLMCPSEHECLSQVGSSRGMSAILCHYPGSYKKSVVCWLGLTVGQTVCVCVHNLKGLREVKLRRHTVNMAAVHRLVIVRHGESAWNQENRFCGWFDADLSEKGTEEAKRGAQAIKDAGMKFDVCYTSVLKRAVKTLWTIMEGTDQMWLPVHRTWRLNERHYGGLTGLNKAETAEKHGEEQVKIWRRSFDTPPPPMDKEHAYNKIISEVRQLGEKKYWLV